MILKKLSPEALVRTSSRHPWVVIGLWVAIIIVSLALMSTLLSGVLTTGWTFTNNPESKRAETLLEDRLRGPKPANEIVIIRSDTLTVDSPAFQEYVGSLYGSIMTLGPEVVAGGINYYEIGDSSLVSADRHTTIIPMTMAGDLDAASDNIERVHAVVREADGKDGFQALITGEASIGKDFEKVAEEDLRRGEILGVPVALFILALVFAAIVATLIPLILGVVAIVAALGATAVVGQAFEFSFFVVNMITTMGLAVGIDYSLFIVSRYREERRRGLDKNEAIAVAGATAGNTVLFSGMTVVLALAGMLVVPLTIFRSLGSGAALVVVAAMLASQTLLPAMLALLGDRIDSLRIPFLQRKARNQNAGKGAGFWGWVAQRVMRRPVISLALAAGLLIAAAVPVFNMNTGSAGVETLPESMSSKAGYFILNEQFSSGLVSPAEIVISGDISSPGVQQGIERLEETMMSDPSFDGPARLTPNPGGDLALLSVPMADDSASDAAVEAIKRLRSQYIPEAFSGVNAEVLVTGAAAQNADYFDITSDYMPIVFAFVLGLSFLLLTVVFRSLVVPIKAILMNLLSVGAAYGLLVLVFQEGVGAGILGFQQVDTIEAWIPLFLFTILFGLSMDYHVFLLSRIREHFDEKHDNAESVAFGLRSTGAIITGAALIMVAIFGGFANGELVMFQQMGFGLGVAVLLDATIVRSVLVPAAMRLLGAANWYLPSLLQRLPKLQMERQAPASAAVSDEDGPGAE